MTLSRDSGLPTAVAGTVTGLPRTLLRVESAAIAVGATILFFAAADPWWLFAALILVPDIAMLGYLAGPVVGATLYNAVHFYAVPVALGVVGAVLHRHDLIAVALVWMTHIGVDRALGYGLKYRTGFADTHLGRIGRR